MTPEAITAYAALVVTVVTSIVVPQILRRRAARAALDGNKVASWQGLTSALQDERDDLRKRLDAVEGDYKKRMLELEAEYTRQLTEARSRIKMLEDEVAELYRRLYSHPARPPEQ